MGKNKLQVELLLLLFFFFFFIRLLLTALKQYSLSVEYVPVLETLFSFHPLYHFVFLRSTAIDKNSNKQLGQNDWSCTARRWPTCILTVFIVLLLDGDWRRCARFVMRFAHGGLVSFLSIFLFYLPSRLLYWLRFPISKGYKKVFGKNCHTALCWAQFSYRYIYNMYSQTCVAEEQPFLSVFYLEISSKRRKSRFR